MWDALGVAQIVQKMEADGRTVAGWVKTMLDAGCDTFYRTDETGRVTGFFDWDTGRYRNLPPAARRVTAAGLRAQQRPVAENAGASLLNMGDGVLLLEFHSKMNTLDEAVIEMMAEARRVLAEDDSVVGLVVGNDGENFCAGANIAVVAGAAEQGQLEQIRAAVTSLQNTLTAFRYSPKPVVTAVHNRALGGGAEVVMGGWRAVAHAESYIGLVEPGVGLVPAAGGVTALVRRILSAAMRVPHTDPLPAAQQILQTIGMAKVGGSAAESRALGYLRDTDRVVMNRDHLLFAAKQEALSLAAIAAGPPAPAQLFAGGRDLLAALESGVWMMQQAGFISAHDALIGRKLAFIIAGGDLSAPQWVDEQHFLNLEVDAFIELAATEKTQARIRHMLKTGKPLRN
ncbi:MAG: enoyl-CoA hydratase/isomerase family protein [Chloroflexi bacterium]|nr:MAG: enoyl-CoA hydratase/isomerase family protein [Chloroflexota bacterium]